MTVTVDGHVAVLGNDAAPLKAECPELDANPDNGWARGLSDLEDADWVNTRAVHAHLIQATAKTLG